MAGANHQAPPRTVGWVTGSYLTKIFIVGARKLAINVANEELDGTGQWIAVALETEGRGVEAILEQHGHHVIGKFDELAEALLEGGAYGQGWYLGAKAKIEPCACEDFDEGREIAGPLAP